MKKKRKLIAALLCGILLLGAGCTESAEKPDGAAMSSEAAATEGVPTAEEAESFREDTSLNSFRLAMTGTPQLFAAAYFGYHDTPDSDLPEDPFEVMREYAPELCGDLPFLLQIPQDRVIGERGDLFCIVPLDIEAKVAVSRGIWDDRSEQYIYENTLYFSANGGPILLFCNNTGFEPDTQISISGPSGDVIWYPQADDNLCAAPLRNENWDRLFLDFSPYRELLMKEYRDMKGEWVMPTAEMLRGTTWAQEGFRKDGLEVRCRVTFGEDTLSVRWNDGIDEEDHEYPDAAWELTEEEGFAVLSIDFREMAGELRYNLMYHEVYEQLYFGMDVLQQEMPIGWEPLYRFLMPPAVPEPVEMLGDWELAWTEVEGYRETAEPGAGSISVFLNGENGFRISLTDGKFPGKSFSNKELAIYEGELYSGCGNDMWMAYIGYMGREDVIYSVTLTRDGTLLLQLYWEVDGGVPMVAYQGYRRAGQ